MRTLKRIFAAQIQFYLNLKVLHKLMIGFGITLAIVFAITVFNQYSLGRMYATLNNVIKNELDPLVYLNDIRINLASMEVETRDAWLKRDFANLQYLRKIYLPTIIKPNVDYAFKQLATITAAAGKAGSAPGNKRVFGAAFDRRLDTETAKVINELQEQWEQYYEMYQTHLDKPEFFSDPKLSKAQNRSRYFLVEGIGRLVETNYRQKAVLAGAAAEKSYKTQQWWTVLLLLISVLVSLATGVITALTIIHPLRRMADASRKIGSGELHISIPVDRRDEFGEVAQCFNFMAAELRLIIGEIKDAVANVNNHSKQLVAGSQEANAVTMELVDTLTKVADGAELQRTKVNSIHDLVKVVRDFSRLVNDTTGKVNDLSAQSVAKACYGEEAAHEVTKTIEQLKVFMANSGATLKEIQLLFKEINGMVGTVRQIADQTQLLALNAAIEAARAGKYGSGFSVVAGSIGDLAERTRAATGEVQETVKRVQDTFGEISKRIKEENRSIHESGTAVNEMEKVFGAIAVSNRELNFALDHVTKNTAKLTKELEDVVCTVEQIATIALHHQEGTTRASSSANEHFHYTKEIMTISQRLSSWGEHLSRSTAKFAMDPHVRSFNLKTQGK
jgi:methyl-accepting chemotaxis protein